LTATGPNPAAGGRRVAVQLADVPARGLDVADLVRRLAVRPAVVTVGVGEVGEEHFGDAHPGRRGRFGPVRGGLQFEHEAGVCRP